MLPQTNNYQQLKRQHPYRFLVFILVVFSLIGTALWQKQWIFDELKLRNYTPPIAVASLANQVGMTPYAERIFYVNHPNITTGSDFAKACTTVGGEKTIVLGCYNSGQRGITLLGVTEPLLDGVEQVTSAHEMLHSAYDRLSNSDKSKVDSMLMDYYEDDLKDTRILGIIDSYKKTEPNDIVNEMHSIFGTEIANLPKALEDYYKIYFVSRSSVVAYANKYQSEFTKRQNLITLYSAQIAELKGMISSGESDIKAKLVLLNNQRVILDQVRGTDVTAYNDGVPAYNSMVNSYNSVVKEVQRLITEHNSLVVKVNSVVLEENQLTQKLNTNSSLINR